MPAGEIRRAFFSPKPHPIVRAATQRHRDTKGVKHAVLPPTPEHTYLRQPFAGGFLTARLRYSLIP